MEKLKVHLENCYGIKKLDYAANNTDNTNCLILPKIKLASYTHKMEL